MADNKNNQDARDRNKVAGDQDYEVKFIAEKLGVSQQEVKEAIKIVGNDRGKVEEYLKAK